MSMSDKSFLSTFMGSPQLEQLTDDLREAEMSREAPRLMVTEREYKAMRGELYHFADIRESHFVAPREATLFDRILGSFRLETGRLAYFVSFTDAS
jgi:hypothetical protein